MAARMTNTATRTPLKQSVLSVWSVAMARQSRLQDARLNHVLYSSTVSDSGRVYMRDN